MPPARRTTRPRRDPRVARRAAPPVSWPPRPAPVVALLKRGRHVPQGSSKECASREWLSGSGSCKCGLHAAALCLSGGANWVGGSATGYIYAGAKQRTGSGGARVWSCTNGESQRGTDSAQYRPNWTVIISGGGGGEAPLAARPEAWWPARRARCCSPARRAVLYFPLVTRAHSAPWKVPRTAGRAWRGWRAARLQVDRVRDAGRPQGVRRRHRLESSHPPGTRVVTPRPGPGQASREPLPTLRPQAQSKGGGSGRSQCPDYVVRDRCGPSLTGCS